jgi:hypothetical protein
MFDQIEGQAMNAEQAISDPPSCRTRKGAASYSPIEGQSTAAEQAIAGLPSPRVPKRRADQSSEVGHPHDAEQASGRSPASLDTNRSAEGQGRAAEQASKSTPSPIDPNQQAEGQIRLAEQANSCAPSPVDAIVAKIAALQRQRRFMIKSQSRIDRSLEAYLANLAGYRPNVAEDGTKLRDADGKPIQDKDGKKLWTEIGRIRRLVEAGKESGAKVSERAGHSCGAEQAIAASPARKPSRKGGREGQSLTAEQASPLSPSLPQWADVPMILASANSRQIWDNMRTQVEKDMIRLAKQLPVYPWWQAIKGAGDLGLAIIVGEAGDVGSYRDKSALWKRLGLAVIDGGRQRRVAGEAAMAHGYAPARRAEVWTIADSLFKHQWRGADEDTGRIAGPSGPYGEYYGRRKAYLTERERGVNEREPWTPKHIDNDARRYMTKALLRDLRGAWRAEA